MTLKDSRRILGGNLCLKEQIAYSKESIESTKCLTNGVPDVTTSFTSFALY